MKFTSIVSEVEQFSLFFLRFFFFFIICFIFLFSVRLFASIPFERNASNGRIVFYVSQVVVLFTCSVSIPAFWRWVGFGRSGFLCWCLTIWTTRMFFPRCFKVESIPKSQKMQANSVLRLKEKEGERRDAIKKINIYFIVVVEYSWMNCLRNKFSRFYDRTFEWVHSALFLFSGEFTITFIAFDKFWMDNPTWR